MTTTTSRDPADTAPASMPSHAGSQSFAGAIDHASLAPQPSEDRIPMPRAVHPPSEALPPPPSGGPPPQAKRHWLDGFQFDLKMLAFAIAIEIAVAILQWYGGLLMALEYGHDRLLAQQMMMLGPTLFLLVDLARVPMAIGFRTHESRIMRVVLLIGGMAMALITCKSVSQIAEQTFRPRLHDVRVASALVVKTEAMVTELDLRIKAAANAVEAARDEIKATLSSLDASRAELGRHRPPPCSPTVWYDNQGRERRGTHCPTDARLATLTAAVTTATDTHAKATTNLRTATMAWETLAANRKTTEQEAIAAREGKATAIDNSQLHSFVSMVFRCAPKDVTDEQIAFLLYIGVFLPAGSVSLAGFVLACASVHRRPPSVIVLGRAVVKELAKYLKDRR